jgi:hypothetical protein
MFNRIVHRQFFGSAAGARELAALVEVDVDGKYAVVKHDLVDLQRLDYTKRQFKQFLIHLYASNVVLPQLWCFLNYITFTFVWGGSPRQPTHFEKEPFISDSFIGSHAAPLPPPPPPLGSPPTSVMM